MEFPKVFPGASRLHNGLVSTQGKFQDGSPQGVTVHYTASRDISSTVKELASKNLGYHLIIDRDGTIYQCADFSHRLNHAGKAMWDGLSPNQTHLAISLISWGWVKQLAPGAFQSWSGKIVATDDCKQRLGQWWDAATTEQELALLKILRWVIIQGIDAGSICGHDECALPKGRKSDPGGILSLDMPKLRDLIGEALV